MRNMAATASEERTRERSVIGITFLRGGGRRMKMSDKVTTDGTYNVNDGTRTHTRKRNKDKAGTLRTGPKRRKKGEEEGRKEVEFLELLHMCTYAKKYTHINTHTLQPQEPRDPHMLRCSNYKAPLFTALTHCTTYSCSVVARQQAGSKQVVVDHFCSTRPGVSWARSGRSLAQRRSLLDFRK